MIDRNGKLANGRPSALAGLPSEIIEADDPPTPPPEETPDWSERTIHLFSNLTVLERCFVEWFVNGRTAAESYRIASKRTGYLDKNSAHNGAAIRHKPHVKVAIESALQDANFGARHGREWKLNIMINYIAKLRASEDPEDGDRLMKALKLMAEFQGEYVKKQEVTAVGAESRSDINVFLTQILNKADNPPAQVIRQAELRESVEG